MATFEIKLRVRAEDLASAESLRDYLAQLVDAGNWEWDVDLIAAACAHDMPRFRVKGVDTDRRKKQAEPFEEVVEAENEEAVREQYTGTKVVVHVEPALAAVG